MALDTWLTRELGLSVPLVQAPMARVSDGRLAAAVSSAGALGMVAAGAATSPDWIAEHAAQAARSGAPFGVGLMAWAVESAPEQVDAAAESAARLVSVSFGPFEEPVRRLRDAGKLVATQVGTVAEARRAVAAGVDVLVARGAEGGGHGRNDVGTLPLLQAVLDAVDVPVLAAGGIGTARGLAAVLAAGAAGAWAGTAFLACRESGFPAASRERLRAADETGTAYGRVFDLASRAAWPAEYGGRALRNRFFDEWVGREDQLAADDAAQRRYAEAVRERDFDTSVIYAGQGVGLLGEDTTAAEVVEAFRGAEDLLRRYC